MKFFIDFKLSVMISDEEKEKIRIKVIELFYFSIEKFCGTDKKLACCVGNAISEAIYNSILHGGTEKFLEVWMGITCRKRRLLFVIKDKGDFYNKQEIKKAIKNKDLEKLINFKPHKKSCGFGFEIIFESSPKIKILNGILCLIWEKACD